MSIVQNQSISAEVRREISDYSRASAVAKTVLHTIASQVDCDRIARISYGDIAKSTHFKPALIPQIITELRKMGEVVYRGHDDGIYLIEIKDLKKLYGNKPI